MRVRRLSAAGDMQFGQSQGNFWVNVPDGVAQCVMTRLRLGLGEWFANLADGTAWNTQVLGERTQATRDLVVRDRVNNAPGVQAILSYSSTMDVNSRTWSATMTVQTMFGAVALAMAKLPADTSPPLIPLPAGQQMVAQLLNILSGKTPITSLAADLRQGPQADIANFQIQSLDPGTF